MKSGDTLTKIARANGTTVGALRRANNITGAQIAVGQRLIIPGKETAPESDYTGRTRWVYQELRDRKVALFIDKLAGRRLGNPLRFPRGSARPISRAARARPGDVCPEIRANSAEVRINVEDEEK